MQERTLGSLIAAGAIIGDGDRKSGVHATPSKEINVPFLSYFEKNSSLVGLNFGLCIYVSMTKNSKSFH